MNRLFSFFTILILLLVFLLLLVSTVLVFDYIGVINVHSNIPEFLKQYKIVQDYLDEVSIRQMPYEVRIHHLVEREIERNKQAQARIKVRENEIIQRFKELQDWEHKLNQTSSEVSLRYETLLQQEQELKQKQQELSEALKDLESRRQNSSNAENNRQQELERMARIYERMEPDIAARTMENLDDDTVFELFSLIREKQAAAIMSQMNQENIQRIFESLSP